MKRKVVIAAVCLCALLSVGWVLLAAKQKQNKTNAQVERAKATDVTGKTVAAANAFLATLDDAGRAKASFPFNSEQKRRWSNFPIGIYPRNGLRMGDLSAPQRAAVMQLLATALSQRVLQKVKEIMEGDEVLKRTDIGRPGGPPPGAIDGPPPNSPTGARPLGGGPPSGMDPGFGRDNYYIALLARLR